MPNWLMRGTAYVCFLIAFAGVVMGFAAGYVEAFAPHLLANTGAVAGLGIMQFVFFGIVGGLVLDIVEGRR